MKYIELRKKIEQLFDAEKIDDYADIDWIMVEILKVKRSMLPFYGEISSENENFIMEAIQKRLKQIWRAKGESCLIRLS